MLAPFGNSVELSRSNNEDGSDSSDDNDNNWDKAIALGGGVFRDGTFLDINEETSDFIQWRWDLVKINNVWQVENVSFIGFTIYDLEL